MCSDIFSLCNTFSWTLIKGLHCPPQFLLLWKRQQLICMLTFPFSALLPGGDSRSMSTSNGINIFTALHPKRFAKAVGWLTSHQLGPPCPHHYFVILTNSKTILFKKTITESPKKQNSRANKCTQQGCRIQGEHMSESPPIDSESVPCTDNEHAETKGVNPVPSTAAPEKNETRNTHTKESCPGSVCWKRYRETKARKPWRQTVFTPPKTQL